MKNLHKSNSLTRNVYAADASSRTIELSRRRAIWAKNRKRVMLKGTRLAYNTRAQDKYVAKLKGLVKYMAKITAREVTALFEAKPAQTFFAMDADIASQARILTNRLTSKFDKLFAFKSKEYAEEMVGRTDRLSATATRESLKKISGGLTINTKRLDVSTKTILKASVNENVLLIKSIGAEYTSNIQKMVMRSITTGNGLQDIIPALSKYEGISERKAKNIALDQTRKVYNSLNKGRLTKAGVKKFEWVHSGGGQKPREEHIAMDGQIYDFDDPPVIDSKTGDRGIPGTAINCGCTFIPVVEFDDGEGTDE